MFLAGGLLDRLARDRSVGAGGVLLGLRRLVLPLPAAGRPGCAVYCLLSHAAPVALRRRCIVAWTRDLVGGADRRSRCGSRFYAVFTALVCGVNLLFDYAKIRAVVEDRRSMIGALAAGTRFVARHPAKTLRLYAAEPRVWPCWWPASTTWWRPARGGPGGVRGRAALHRAAGDRAAAVHGVADRALPEPARARGIRRPARSAWPESPAAEAIGRKP